MSFQPAMLVFQRVSCWCATLNLLLICSSLSRKLVTHCSLAHDDMHSPGPQMVKCFFQPAIREKINYWMINHLLSFCVFFSDSISGIWNSSYFSKPPSANSSEILGQLLWREQMHVRQPYSIKHLFFFWGDILFQKQNQCLGYIPTATK